MPGGGGSFGGGPRGGRGPGGGGPRGGGPRRPGPPPRRRGCLPGCLMYVVAALAVAGTAAALIAAII